MRAGWVGVSLGVAVCSFAAAVRAADVPPPAPAPVAAAPPVAVPSAASPVGPVTRAPKVFAPLADPKMSHRLQFGIAILPGIGYRGVFPYQENINCGQVGKRVCTSTLPVFLDVQPSFGFAQHWDVLFDLRFGLGKDFTGSRQLAVAPGVRYWVDPDESAKFFATIQMAYDTTAQNDPALTHNNDFALRNSNGFMYEIMRNFGAYIQFGETIGFVRWLRFEIDGGIGVQARLP